MKTIFFLICKKTNDLIANSSNRSLTYPHQSKNFQSMFKRILLINFQPFTTLTPVQYDLFGAKIMEY